MSAAARLPRLRVRFPPEAWISFCCECCVCCQVEVSASSWSLVQRSFTDCRASECDREASIMRRPWPTGLDGWLLSPEGREGGKMLNTHITARSHTDDTQFSASTYCELPSLCPTLNFSVNYTYQPALAWTNSSLLPHSVMKRRTAQFSPKSRSHLKSISIRMESRNNLHTRTHKKSAANVQ